MMNTYNNIGSGLIPSNRKVFVLALHTIENFRLGVM